MSEFSALRIEKMPHGGFVVTDGRGDAGFIAAALFASSSIGVALAFIAGRLDPEAHKLWLEQVAKAAENVAKAASDLEASRAFAKPRDPHGSDRRIDLRAGKARQEAFGIRLCVTCKSSGMGRYCSRPNCTERGLGY